MTGHELSPGAVARVLSVLPVTAGSLHAPDGVPEALEAALLARNPRLRIHVRPSAGGHDAALLIGAADFAGRLRQATRRVKDTGVVGFLVPNARHFTALDLILRENVSKPVEGIDRTAILRAAGEADSPLGRLGSVIEDRAAAEAAVLALRPYLERIGVPVNEAFERLGPSHFVGQTRPRKGRGEPIRVSGATLGSKPDAMAIVRMQAPLNALNTLPNSRSARSCRSRRSTGRGGGRTSSSGSGRSCNGGLPSSAIGRFLRATGCSWWSSTTTRCGGRRSRKTII